MTQAVRILGWSAAENFDKTETTHKIMVGEWSAQVVVKAGSERAFGFVLVSPCGMRDFTWADHMGVERAKREALRTLRGRLAIEMQSRVDECAALDKWIEETF